MSGARPRFRRRLVWGLSGRCPLCGQRRL